MKRFVLVVMLALCANLGFAQSAEPPSEDKFFAGGNFGLTLGRYTVINLSPQIGYRFNRFVSGGAGFNLQYASLKQSDRFGNDYSKTSQGITGLNLFGRLYPVQNIFLQVQPEANYIFGRITYYQPAEQVYKMDAEIVPGFLLGGGLAFPSGRGTFLTTVLYDVLQRPASPYGKQPFVNIGYNLPF